MSFTFLLWAIWFLRWPTRFLLRFLFNMQVLICPSFYICCYFSIESPSMHWGWKLEVFSKLKELCVFLTRFWKLFWCLYLKAWANILNYSNREYKSMAKAAIWQRNLISLWGNLHSNSNENWLGAWCFFFFFFIFLMPELRWLATSFPPLRPMFDPRSSHVEFVVDRVALGWVQVLPVSYASSHSPCSLIILPSTLHNFNADSVIK
jgi:hypothetical protein